MRILEINDTDLGSTGRIMLNIARVARQRGHEVMTASKYTRTSALQKRNDPHHVYVGNRLTNTIHRYWAWTTDLQDTGSVLSTLNLLRKIERFNPDLIHMHDILGWYLNIDILFKYLRRKNIPVVWTFHDCWGITGRCIYFDAVGCDNWRRGCGNCPKLRIMPHTWWFDRSAWNFRRKDRLFSMVDDMTIITPSEWLASLTRESMHRERDIRVINNGIDLSVFKPTQGDLFQRLTADGRKILLGVAGTWSERKGLDVFKRLSKELPESYKIVLVGLDEADVADAPDIIAIKRTHNQQELAQIYTAAQVLVNPTVEENFPTVNLEALACGTPIVTYRTGGSPESVSEGCGEVVEKGDYNALKEASLRIAADGRQKYSDRCIKHSRNYDMHDRFNDYVDLFESIVAKHK